MRLQGSLLIADVRVKLVAMERVLVCLTGSTRGHEVAFPSFKRNVLDELNADLALAIAIDERYDTANPLWQYARYRWTVNDTSDYGDAFDSAQQAMWQHRVGVPPDWRTLLRIKGIWQGGIHSSDPQESRSAVLPLCRWRLLNGLRQDGVLERYDRFVVTRSDFVWLCPHPPLTMLDPGHIWIPDGEHYDGLADRHLVVSRAHVMHCLDQLEAILLQPDELARAMEHYADWNNEQCWKLHLERKGLLSTIRMFPYVMYLARHHQDNSPTWSRGTYHAPLKHFVKYDTEFALASQFARIIRSRADWKRVRGGNSTSRRCHPCPCRGPAGRSTVGTA